MKHHKPVFDLETGSTCKHKNTHIYMSASERSVTNLCPQVCLASFCFRLHHSEEVLTSHMFVYEAKLSGLFHTVFGTKQSPLEINEHSSVIALHIFQNGVTSIRWQRWFTEPVRQSLQPENQSNKITGMSDWPMFSPLVYADLNQ